MAIEIEIRRMRLRLGWTQEYLGKMVGVRQATISRIESNPKHSSWGIIHRILIALSLDTSDLKGFTHDFILKESDFDLFFQLLLSNSQLRTSILYNPIHCANIIIDAHNEGIINFDHKYKNNKLK